MSLWGDGVEEVGSERGMAPVWNIRRLLFGPTARPQQMPFRDAIFQVKQIEQLALTDGTVAFQLHGVRPLAADGYNA